MTSLALLLILLAVLFVVGLAWAFLANVRPKVKIATLMALVVLAALVFRGCVYSSGTLTIAIVNKSGATLRDVTIKGDGSQALRLGSIAPGKSVQAVVRNAPTSGLEVFFQKSDEPEPTTIPLVHLRRSRGSRMHRYQLTVTPSGTAISMSVTFGIPLFAP